MPDHHSPKETSAKPAPPGKDGPAHVAENAVAPRTADEAETATERPTEIGGQKGPEPTRYGDWERGGRCTDF